MKGKFLKGGQLEITKTPWGPMQWISRPSVTKSPNLVVIMLDDLRGRACDEVRVLEALGEPGEVLVGLADLALEARALLGGIDEALEVHHDLDVAAGLHNLVNTTVDKVVQATRALANHPVSLDARVSSDDPRSVADILSVPEEQTPGERLDMLRAEEQMRTALLELAPMERDILRQRFGLDGQEPRTLAEIGEQYSLSRERIRQLQEQALGKIRRELRRREML